MAIVDELSNITDEFAVAVDTQFIVASAALRRSPDAVNALCAAIVDEALFIVPAEAVTFATAFIVLAALCMRIPDEVNADVTDIVDAASLTINPATVAPDVTDDVAAT